MTYLCPRGHRVKLLPDKRGACGGCENVYPHHFLIPVKGKVGKKNYPLYARAYRLGYRAALVRNGTLDP